MKNRSFLLLVLLVFCCFSILLIAGFFALFISIGDDRDCTYDAPFSLNEPAACEDEDEDADESEDTEDESDEDETTDDKDETDSEDTNEEDSEDITRFSGGIYDEENYTLEIAEGWYIDNSTSTLYIYTEDPDTTFDGLENINVIEYTDYFDEGTELTTSSGCEEYGEGVVSQLEGVYDDIVFSSSKVVSTNGVDACRIRFEGVYLTTELKQEQYYINNEDEDGDDYIMTLTYFDDSEYYDQMVEVFESFRIK